MAASFQTHSLRFRFTLGKGKFASSETNTLDIVGARSIVHIKNAGGATMPALTAQVFGLLESDMNDLTFVFAENFTRQANGSQQKTDLQSDNLPVQFNLIEVFADNVLIYQGTIYLCLTDYSSAPDVSLKIQAQVGYFEQVNPVPADSRDNPGGIDVATIVSDICTKIGVKFQNQGVEKKVPNITLGGTLISRLKKLSYDYQFDLIWEPDLLIIVPAAQKRTDQQRIPLISAGSGLVGWPAFNQNLIEFTSLYNPSVTFRGQIKMEVTMQNGVQPKFNGLWTVTSIDYYLESEKPGGQWFMKCVCAFWQQG